MVFRSAEDGGEAYPFSSTPAVHEAALKEERKQNREVTALGAPFPYEGGGRMIRGSVYALSPPPPSLPPLFPSPYDIARFEQLQERAKEEAVREAEEQVVKARKRKKKDDATAEKELGLALVLLHEQEEKVQRWEEDKQKKDSKGANTSTAAYSSLVEKIRRGGIEVKKRRNEVECAEESYWESLVSVIGGRQRKKRRTTANDRGRSYKAERREKKRKELLKKYLRKRKEQKEKAKQAREAKKAKEKKERGKREKGEEEKEKEKGEGEQEKGEEEDVIDWMDIG